MKKAISLALTITAIISAQAQGVSSAQGKQLFMDRCTSCHSVAKEVVGPALKDVGKRRSEEWIVNFVHSSQTVIKSGDTAAVRLFESHSRTVMPDHPRPQQAGYRWHHCLYNGRKRQDRRAAGYSRLRTR